MQPVQLQANVEMLDDGRVRLTTQTTVARTQFAVKGNMFGMVGAKTTLKASLVFCRDTV